jgi:hypothetical protein
MTLFVSKYTAFIIVQAIVSALVMHHILLSDIITNRHSNHHYVVGSTEVGIAG